MKSVKPHVKSRGGSRAEQSSRSHGELVTVTSAPLLAATLASHLPTLDGTRSPQDGVSASDTVLSARLNGGRREEPVRLERRAAKGDERGSSAELAGDMQRLGSASPVREARRGAKRAEAPAQDGQRIWTKEKQAKCFAPSQKKNSRPSTPLEIEEPLTRQIREIHTESRKSARIIKDSRARLLEIQKKATLTEADVKELGQRNELLLREMERFDRLTRGLRTLVGAEVAELKKTRDHVGFTEYIPGTVYEPALHHEMRMAHPTVVLAGRAPAHAPAREACTRSKSEIDLTRKLSESYDMQEKLVADNADLEVKRYILYKELMTKDQNLETCRAQVKRLQGELKMMNRENSLLQEKLSKNNPEGDASAMNQDSLGQQNLYISTQDKNSDGSVGQELVSKLENYKLSTLGLEKQLCDLEVEARHIRVEMDAVKLAATKMPQSQCHGGANTCFKQGSGPPEPPMKKACGVCPPCPAPCNPNAPPTPAEREVARLTLQLRQTEENFKTKVTECAMLRADLLKKKEELEKERCQHREVQNKLRELEMRFEGLTAHTNMMLGTKEQALENEVNVRALKQCYREAKEEIEELRVLMKEQNDQLQDYRVKYMSAQQLVEEQRRQMDLMDLDNSRISEQINLEIQRVKLKFQEKLQELAPIPELLKATQMRLKDAQQAQALAEHNAEQLARELNCAREKVHVLLHNTIKPPPEKTEKDKSADEKQISLLQQRITQLVDLNQALKQEIERLKSNVIRMEESVLINEKRLQEKIHECAQLGGELDRTRDEAARALTRASERTETIRKCLQTTIAELERQLAFARAQVSSADKEREELQCRMKCQIKRLNENFEQAQLRILGLTAQVQTLRRTASSTDGEGDAEQTQECLCKTMFENP